MQNRTCWTSGATLALLALAAGAVSAGQTAQRLHASRSASATFDVRAFGARGDGKTLDTGAIDAAIAAAARAGGGTVRFPAGRYLSASIHLMSDVGLFLDHGAVLEAVDPSVAGYDPPEPNEWGDVKKYQDFGHSHWHDALLWGEGLHDVSITGPGLIYGKGLVRNERGPKGAGTKAISLKNCRNVLLRDVSILHGGWFAILATGVDNLTIEDLKIDTNRDGIDVDACRNVRISDTTVNSPFDDGICLKSSFGLGRAQATENVTISNCQVSGYDEGTLLDGTFRRTVRYEAGPTGRIKFGTESNGGFRNVVISNCVFEHSRGLAIETVDGGPIEDVRVSNLTMRDVFGAPIFVRLGRRMRGPAGTPVGVVRRVSISGVTASGVSSDQGVLVSGVPGHPIEGLRLSDIRIVTHGGGAAEDAAIETPELEDGYPEPARFGRLPAWAFFVRHVSGLVLERIEAAAAAAEARPALRLEDVTGADLERIDLPHPPGGPALVLRDVRNLRLHDCRGWSDRQIESVRNEAY